MDDRPDFADPAADDGSDGSAENAEIDPWAGGAPSAAGEARERHEAELMAIDGVMGVGLGRDDIGDDAVIVYVRDRGVCAQLPAEVGGVAVRCEVTGIIEAY